MLPFRLTPVLGAIAAIAVLLLVWRAVHEYGDYRANQVHLLYATAADDTNKDLSAFAGEDDARAVKTLTELRLRAAAAAQLKSDLPYTAEQAAAITAIRRAGNAP